VTPQKVTPVEGAALTADGQPHGGSALLGRSRAALRRLSGDEPVAPPAPRPFEDTLIDAGSLDAWEFGMPAPGIGARRGNLETLVWSALALGRPALRGAQQALPHLQRLGAKNALIAGAVVAGAVAAAEVALRAQDGLGRGTPQGGALSPLLANIYLHPFDVALTSQGLRLVRFVDDLVVMCGSEAEAGRALQLTQRQLATLRLQLNPEKTRVIAYGEGLEFLGQAFAARQRGPRLGAGLESFGEAEKLLRDVAAQARDGAKAARDKLRRRK
jgi:RNA-directed DNA polymerase